MTVTVSATKAPVLVQYKLKGVTYNANATEANANAHPFDEHTVEHGSTWELPEGATLIAHRELGDAPQPNTAPTGN